MIPGQTVTKDDPNHLQNIILNKKVEIQQGKRGGITTPQIMTAFRLRRVNHQAIANKPAYITIDGVSFKHVFPQNKFLTFNPPIVSELI